MDISPPPSDALAALAELLQDDAPPREPGWYTMEEIKASAEGGSEQTIRSRLTRRVRSGDLEVRKATVLTPIGKRICNVYRKRVK